MRTADDELLAELQVMGLSPSDLFVAGGALFVSEDAGDFRASSVYEPLPPQLTQKTEEFLSLVHRLGAPEYASLAEVADQILQCREWEDIYSKLMLILPKYGVLDACGDGDYFLIDDNYGSPQHKIECTSSIPVAPQLLAEIQEQLVGYSREWEVIIVQESAAGKVHVFLVYSNRFVEHDA